MKRLISILLLAASITSAQFTDDCVATAGGRRVTVEPDGSFTLYNLPEGRHLIRIYVTCHHPNGTVDYGRSELIEVQAGQRITVGDFDSASTPFHAISSLRLRSTRQVLTSIGSQARITPVATLSNGTQLNVTTRATGTIYSTSNPDVATVDASGFLTARGIGRVIISASNDGVVGSIALSVSFGDLTDVVGFVTNSSTATLRVLGQAAEFATGPDGSFRIDGQVASTPLTVFAYDNTATGPRVARKDDLTPVPRGITDAGFLTLAPASTADIQVILGSDGSSDGDFDGLSELGEFLSGTNASNPDSDNNGTNDGDEDFDGDTLSNAVEIAIGGNPLLADSDGDGFSDVEEQLQGTALDDPASRPKHVARALPLSYHNSLFADSANRSQATPVSYLNLNQQGVPQAPVSRPLRYETQAP